jgi:hypothetical protein
VRVGTGLSANCASRRQDNERVDDDRAVRAGGDGVELNLKQVRPLPPQFAQGHDQALDRRPIDRQPAAHTGQDPGGRRADLGMSRQPESDPLISLLSARFVASSLSTIG